MGKIFIINDASITGGVASTHDIGTSSLTWRHGYFSGLITAGTISANIVATTMTVGTVSATGAGIFGTLLTAGSASFTGNLVVGGVASVTGNIIGGATITVGTVSATGQLISASTAGVVGQYAALIYTFGTASSLQVTSIPVPFAGRVENVYVTTGSVSAVVAQYTVRIGSAGSVAVATVANTTASQGVQESLTTTATTYAITNALVVTRSAQGTAGDTAICVVVRKTA